jgi:tetratricopeptide (TPR) repeat protein
MSVRRLALALIALLAFAAVPAVRPAALAARVDDDAWWQVAASDVTVLGDADPEHLRAIAEGIGRFRAVLGSVHPRALLRAAAPVVVVVFRDRESGGAYRPLFEGRPVEVGGTFLPGNDRHLITVSTDEPASDWQALFHEYTHLVIQQTLRQVPPWLDEGLAEYHSTVTFTGNGRRAETGRVHEAHVRLLSREPMLPLLELLSATREDALYNEGDRRGMFYAQSWLLAHYLMADADRAVDAFAYLDEIDRGATVEQALDRALGTTPALLDKELRDYLRHSTFGGRHVALPDTSGGGRPRAVALSLADAFAWRGDLLLRLDRRAEAREAFERALGFDAQHPRALAGLGRLAAAERQPSEACALLARASAQAPNDPVVQVRYAHAVLDRLRLAARPAATGGDELRASEQAARRALDAFPRMAEAHAILATVALARGDAESAAAHARRGVDLAPARDELRLLLAQAELAADRTADAGLLLRALAERGQTPRLRADAARLLEDLDARIRRTQEHPDR